MIEPGPTRYRLTPGTRIWCSADGLFVVAGRALRVRLGPPDFERELVAGLASGSDLAELRCRHGDVGVDRALEALAKRGVVGTIPAAVQVVDLGSGLVARDLPLSTSPASPVEVTEGTLLILHGKLFDERIGSFHERARALRTPSLVSWISGAGVALAWDDGTSRPCARCALLFDREAWSSAAEGRFSEQAPAGAPFIETASSAVDAVAAALIARFLDSGAERPTPGRALVVDTRSWKTSWERYLAHPSCTCVHAPVGAALDPVAMDWETLCSMRFPPLLCLDAGGPSRLARVAVRRARSPWERAAGSFGFASALGEDASTRALAEGIERFAMLHTPAHRTATTARDLGDATLEEQHVEALLFRKEERKAPGFRLRGFNRDAALEWSWIEHARSGRRALVPTSLVGRPGDGTPLLVDVTSNGYAAHTDRSRAVALALLELIERDAVLLAWYFGLEVSAIDTEEDPRVAALDADVSAFLATQDIDLPVVWLLAQLPDGSLRSASAAACSFRAAWERAMRELGAAILASGVGATGLHGPVVDLDDASQWHGPEDHLQWYRDRPRARAARTGVRTSDVVSLASLELRWPTIRTDGRLTVVDALEAAKLSAWFCDRSQHEVFGRQWHVIRALIPGVVELSWGQAYRRLASPRAARLLRAGRALNPWPHPIA